MYTEGLRDVFFFIIPIWESFLPVHPLNDAHTNEHPPPHTFTP